MDVIFKRGNEIKQEYLNTKPTATAEANIFVLRSADEYEDMVNKSIYNMDYSDLREMLIMQFRNSSVKTVLKNVSILKKYIDFCIDKKIVEHGENKLTTFTIKEAKKLVHKQALLSKYINRKRLKKYQNILYNEQDQLLIELLFIGVRGRTVENGTLEEVINLTMPSREDEENNILTLIQNNGQHRQIKIETSTIALIRNVYEQDIYVENNGEETNNLRLGFQPRKIKINKVENYVLRVPGKNKYEKFTPNLLNSRMKRIQKYLDNYYISFTSLYQSGMIQMAMDRYEKNGEITKDDYIDICIRFNYGSGDPEKYWFNVKSLFKQYKELLNL